jgi:hypothetical protein
MNLLQPFAQNDEENYQNVFPSCTAMLLLIMLTIIGKPFRIYNLKLSTSSIQYGPSTFEFTCVWTLKGGFCGRGFADDDEVQEWCVNGIVVTPNSFF